MSFKAGSIVAEAVLDTTKWTTGQTKINNSLSSIKSSAKTMSLAVAGYLTASTVIANEFQIEMGNVSTVLDTSVDSTQDMSAALLELDPRLGQTTDLAQALYLAFSAGSEDAAEGLQVTTDSAKFAAAALTDTTTSLDILTTAQNAYGREVMSTTEASDIFFTTIEEGKITGDELSATIGQSIPLFASAGVNLTNLGAGMATITKQGASASESTTQLNAIINSVLRPTTELKAAIEEYGYASGGALLEAEGLTGVLNLMEEATQGNIDKVTEFTPNIRALRGILALTGVGGEIYTEVLGEMESATGATDIAFAKQERTFVTLISAMNKIGIVTGNIAKYFIDDLAIAATSAADSVLTFITSSEGMELVGNIAGFTAGTFDLLREVVTTFADMINTDPMIENLSTLSDNLGDSGDAGVVFATAMETAALTVNILGYAITDSVRLVDLFAESVYTKMNFLGTAFKSFKVMFQGDEEKAALTKEVAELRQIAIDAADEFKEHSETQGVRLSEVFAASFLDIQDKSKDLSTKLDITFTNTFEGMKDNVLNNWLEIYTGQKQTVEQSEEDYETSLSNSTFAHRAFTEAIVTETDDSYNIIQDLSEELFDSFDTLFSKAEFSWQGLAENMVYTMNFAIDSMTTSFDLYYSNQEDALDIWEQRQYELVEAGYSRRIALIEEQEGVAADMVSSYRQGELDDLEEKTTAEIELDTYLRQQKIDGWREENTEESRLQLAAFLAEEERLEELNDLTATIEEERDRIAAEYADEEIRRTEEQTLVEETALARSNELAEEAFNIQKSLSIASIWMDAATAIAGFWANAPLLGPVAGPVFAATMTAAVGTMAGFQTALVNQQQYVPAFAEGGMASGIVQVNEEGGEIISLPDGSQVIPNDISRIIASNTGNSEPAVIIQFNNTQVNNGMDVNMMANKISRVLGRELRNKR